MPAAVTRRLGDVRGRRYSLGLPVSLSFIWWSFVKHCCPFFLSQLVEKARRMDS